MPKAVADAVREDILMFAPTSPPIRRPSSKNGLSRGVVPSSLRRRTTPVRWSLSGSGPPNSSSGIPGPKGPSSRFCVCPRRPLSPMMMNSLALSRSSSRRLAVIVRTIRAREPSRSSPRPPVATAIAAIVVAADLEPDDAAVVVPAGRLAGVGLKRAQSNQVALESQRPAIPDEAIDAIAAQRCAGEIHRIDRVPAGSIAVLSVQNKYTRGLRGKRG